MEEKEIMEGVELQTTFNEDTIEQLNDGEFTIENQDQEEVEGIGSADSFSMRTCKPSAGNKFYNNGNNGGSSWCVNGNPTDKSCNVLANCVGYACGRFNEIIGSFNYKTLCCNAENFIEKAKESGLKISPVPTLGGIMVWKKGATLSGSDGAGHVAIVERIDNANQIYTSESGWGSSTPFWNQIRKNDNGRWGIGSGYTFRGCIVNPAIGEVKAGGTTPSSDISKKSTEELAREVIAGKYGNGETRRNALGSRYSEVQAKVNEILNSNNKPTTPTTPSNPTPSVDILTMVKKTIRGDYGNGEARRKALGSNYDEVQRQVNLNFKNGTTNWNNIRLY